MTEQGPSKDIVELTLFGPGYGESAVAHIGDGKWFVVDSCINPRTGKSAPLEYLEGLGVDVSVAVIAIIITHYDDDHIAGMADLVAASKGAKVITSNVYQHQDFLNFIALIDQAKVRRGSSGLSNIAKTFDALKVSGQRLIRASKNRQIFSKADFTLSHGAEFTLRTLSPSDFDQNNFLAWLASEMPKAGTTRRALPKATRNDVSIAVDFRVGAVQFLLGADLEERSNPDSGWSAVINHSGREPGKAQIYKVAHHGSHTGHHADIWTELLEDYPLAIVAPWINGGKIVPKDDDRNVICGLTPFAFVTSAARVRRPKKRDAAVEKRMKATAKDHMEAVPENGMVRLRRPVSSKAQIWSLELIDTARPLTDWPQVY